MNQPGKRQSNGPQTDHSHVHVTREDDVTKGVSERSEVFEHVPGVPGQVDKSKSIRLTN